MGSGDFASTSTSPTRARPSSSPRPFLASGAWHTYQRIHYQSWRLTGLYVSSAVLLVAGFVTRAVGAWDHAHLIKYIFGTRLIYAAPYASLLLQLAVLASLLLLLLLLLLLAGVFRRRSRRAGPAWRANRRRLAPLRTLYAGSGLILARTVFRVVVEYWAVADARAEEAFAVLHSSDKMHTAEAAEAAARLPAEVTHEGFFWVVEAAVLLANHVMWGWRHPRLSLPRSSAVCLDDDGVTEVVGTGDEDDRTFWVTVLDPFDVAGMVARWRDGGEKDVAVVVVGTRLPLRERMEGDTMARGRP
ncbi:hypothetical protein VTJ83DRAFT_2949 [Remersonia thermophila]|uniref:Uncharacterized protein n=1 Tax=Remersonia thermophila TaxID=72144 RepID=A0ABR4DCN2_9PEZI